MSRIYLSPPHLAGDELTALERALRSNWIAPLGPEVDAFEQEFAAVVGTRGAAALSSGTAALHLAVRLLGVKPGDEVLCPTLTFAATANAVIYEGALPVFVDCDAATWNIDPILLRQELADCAGRGLLPAAVITVDALGQSADHDPILDVCAEYGVPVIEDAAEALGATYRNRPLGGFGRFGVFSFNGNKILTTSGGGMLVSDDLEALARARYLAAQARAPAPHYEHTEVGFNYRMSNLLAAVGRAQLAVLDRRVAEKRQVFQWYQDRLGGQQGVELMPEADYGRATRWLTCVLFDPESFGASTEDVRLALEGEDIEARPVWKPLHLQPVYSGRRVRGGQVSEAIFERGLCLPSGSALLEEDVDRICGLVLACRS